MKTFSEDTLKVHIQLVQWNSWCFYQNNQHGMVCKGMLDMQCQIWLVWVHRVEVLMLLNKINKHGKVQRLMIFMKIESIQNVGPPPLYTLVKVSDHLNQPYIHKR